MLGIFLDIETNGLNCFIHRALEIAFKIVDLYDGRLLASYHKIVMQPREVWEKSDLNSLKINGFTWDRVLQGKPEKEIADEILSLFEQLEIKRKKAVFICQNPSFDRAFFSQIVDPFKQELLQWPYHWLDFASMFYALSMKEAGHHPYPWEVGLSKNKIAEKMELPAEEMPHQAMNGVEHLLLLYQNLIGFPLIPK